MADRRVDAAVGVARQPKSPGPTGGTLTVLLAIVDFPMLCAGYQALIDAQPDMAVIGVVGGADDLRDQLDATAADVIIAECLPLGAAGCTASSTIEAIRAARPATRILALECRCSGDQFMLALRAGADGFLTRQARPADVLAALRCVSRGETYVSPEIVTQLVNTFVLRSPSGSPEDAYDRLSPREREVLLQAAVGHTNREMARTFGVSEQTVHHHRASVMEKLGFHDRVELTKYAIRRGLIQAADL